MNERFWAKVNKTSTCWIWTGCKQPRGYGHMTVKGERKYAHRFSYELHKGKIPEGLQIDHLCKNKSCVNPEHLEVVTAKENYRRVNPHDRKNSDWYKTRELFKNSKYMNSDIPEYDYIIYDSYE